MLIPMPKIMIKIVIIIWPIEGVVKYLAAINILFLDDEHAHHLQSLNSIFNAIYALENI